MTYHVYVFIAGTAVGMLACLSAVKVRRNVSWAQAASLITGGGGPGTPDGK